LISIFITPSSPPSSQISHRNTTASLIHSLKNLSIILALLEFHSISMIDLIVCL
jgi:hypothetical protein